MVIRRQLVRPPMFTPSLYGLMSVAEIRDDPNPHWKLGVNYLDLCGIADTTYDECVNGVDSLVVPPPADKATTASINYRGAAPFTVYSRIDCSPVGFWNDAPTNARQSLERTEGWAVEQTIWTGNVPVSGGGSDDLIYPYLTSDMTTVDDQGITTFTAASLAATGGPHLASIAMGYLESALADCYNGQGVIHVPALLLPTLIAHHQVKLDGNRYRTCNGNLVAVGNGYPGTGPGGVAHPEGGAWMFATGAVFVYRSDVTVLSGTEAFDRDTNTVQVITERTYAVGWECCHFAVLTLLGDL